MPDVSLSPAPRRFVSRQRPAAACLAACAMLLAAAARAQDVPAPLPAPVTTDARYVLGVMLSRSPDYTGSSQSPWKLNPLWAWQYGRYRLSTSRATAVLGFGGEAVGPGASAQLVDSERVKLGAALRIDGGRSSSDSPDLAGLPEIRRTLRGRVYASWTFAPTWTLGSSLSQDLLGRQGGAQATLDVGTGGHFSDRSEWSVGGGLTVGNGQYMRSYFGVTEAAAQTSGLAAFRPQGGLRDVHVGVGYTTAITPRWIAFVSAGASTLLGDAANSPLTGAATSTSMSAGIAYRCCR